MKVKNKRAFFDYELGRRFEAGIVLSGGEAKAARLGRANISKSYARIIDEEAYLINANIPVEGAKDYDATRTRKLLLHKKEIEEINAESKAKRLTIVPLNMYTKARLIKVEIALAKSKKKHDKREALKKKDIELEIKRRLKN